MKTGRGVLKQDFRVKLNIEDLVNYIVDAVIKEVSDDLDNVVLDEWEIDDKSLIISGEYSSKFKSSWCDATLESPAEWNIERDYIDFLNLGYLGKEFSDFIKVTSIEEKDEDVDYGDNE